MAGSGCIGWHKQASFTKEVLKVWLCRKRVQSIQRVQERPVHSESARATKRDGKRNLSHDDSKKQERKREREHVREKQIE
jgi:hypothetical protein